MLPKQLPKIRSRQCHACLHRRLDPPHPGPMPSPLPHVVRGRSVVCWEHKLAAHDGHAVSGQAQEAVEEQVVHRRQPRNADQPAPTLAGPQRLAQLLAGDHCKHNSLAPSLPHCRQGLSPCLTRPIGRHTQRHHCPMHQRQRVISGKGTLRLSPCARASGRGRRRALGAALVVHAAACRAQALALGGLGCEVRGDHQCGRLPAPPAPQHVRSWQGGQHAAARAPPPAPSPSNTRCRRLA